MHYALAADAIVLLHFAFVLFVVGGSFLAWRWRWLIWVHLPCAVWGAAIEFGGWICPLTPLENRLRWQAGEAGYTGGFVEHYVVPVLYPAELTVSLQLALGTLVVVITAFSYGVYFSRRPKG